MAVNLRECSSLASFLQWAPSRFFFTINNRFLICAAFLAEEGRLLSDIKCNFVFSVSRVVGNKLGLRGPSVLNSFCCSGLFLQLAIRIPLFSGTLCMMTREKCRGFAPRYRLFCNLVPLARRVPQKTSCLLRLRCLTSRP